MIKFAVVLHKRSEMTPQEFRDHLFNVHAPLARKIPGLRRCVYNPVLPDATRKPPPWLCIVELYFDDFDAMQAAWASPEGRAASEDNANFADLRRSSWSIVDEVKIV
jgi:uncharacterized protein (TIGR02118 family)